MILVQSTRVQRRAQIEVENGTGLFNISNRVYENLFSNRKKIETVENVTFPR